MVFFMKIMPHQVIQPLLATQLLFSVTILLGAKLPTATLLITLTAVTMLI
jgi:hypothetical protein